MHPEPAIVPDRYHLFVDETGQHTRGEYFLVCAVAVPTVDLERLRNEVSAVEARIGPPWRKWVHSTVQRKRRYLEAAKDLVGGLAPVHYRNHGGGTDYICWTGQLIAAAILARVPEAQVTVVVDGYNPNECHAIQAALRASSVRWAKVRGAKDESEPLLRLVDSLTGYLGDIHRSKPYTAPYAAVGTNPATFVNGKNPTRGGVFVARAVRSPYTQQRAGCPYLLAEHQSIQKVFGARANPGAGFPA